MRCRRRNAVVGMRSEGRGLDVGEVVVRIHDVGAPRRRHARVAGVFASIRRRVTVVRIRLRIRGRDVVGLSWDDETRVR